MKFLFTLVLIVFSVNVFAESPACDAVTEALGVDPVPSTDGTLRKFQFMGKTKKKEGCQIQFMPDFCTFQLGLPLEAPLMYYLKDTDLSSIKIRYRAGEKFFMRSVTKESESSSDIVKRRFTKILNLKKTEEGIEVEFKMSEGRFFKDEIAGFSCLLTGAGSPE